MSTGKRALPDKDLSFEARSIESLKSLRRWPERGGLHSCFQIVWIIKGAGYYSIDMERFPLANNTLYFLPPGRMHHLHSMKETEGWVLSFNPVFLHLSAASAWMHSFKEMVARFSSVMVLNLMENPAEGMLIKVVKEMIRESAVQQSLNSEALGGLLHIFLIYLQRLAAPVQRVSCPSKQVDMFNTFYSRVQSDFVTKRHVSEYATELSVTPSYLSTVVKGVSGHSASFHIQQRTILEAKRMAMYTDANMKHIAYQLGFYDLAHFSKFFKNVAGMNFTDFRSRNSQSAVSLNYRRQPIEHSIGSNGS